MKSERHAERMALFCASVGACANALVAVAKSAAASNAFSVEICFNVLNIWVSSCPVGNADDLLKRVQAIVAGDAACSIIRRREIYRK
ncbi:hypothetical protein [Bradyrhizobium sp. LB11.1]|uniref:hypothetical protein n=1 Tax=Bradyrhizobium sp. LB11.1 TaxID=3156326 RepID=UPI00339B4EC3